MSMTAALPRKALIFFARLAIVVILYAAIGRAVDLPRMTAEVTTSLVYALAGAIFLSLLQAAICTLRWSLIARPADRVPGFRTNFLAYIEGMFVNQALPSVVGGDALRVIRWREHGVSVADAITTVLLDRIFGVFGAAALALAAVVLLWDAPYARYWLMLGALASAGVLAGCALVFALSRWQRLRKVFRFSSRAACVAAELFRFRLTRKDFSICIAYSVAVHLLSGLGALVLGRSLGIQVAAPILITVTALIVLASMIPISLAGWGVREAGFLAVLLPLGVSAEKAVLLGVLFGLQGLLAALMGGVSMLFGLSAPSLNSDR